MGLPTAGIARVNGRRSARVAGHRGHAIGAKGRSTGPGADLVAVLWHLAFRQADARGTASAAHRVAVALTKSAGS